MKEDKSRINNSTLQKIKTNLLESNLFKFVFGIISFIATILTIYAFIYDKKSNLEFEILSNINVLDLKEDIGKLDILYDSTSLKTTKSNLKVYTLKLINNGDREILIEYFDKRAPIGIKVKSGKIIEKPELIDSNSKYLEDYFRINLLDEQKVEFNQLIFEPNDFLIIKFLVLHNIEEEPKLMSLGKIAGQKDIFLSEVKDKKEDIGYINNVFEGNIWIQFARGTFFLFFWIVILIIIIYTLNKIKFFQKLKKRKKIVEEFKKENIDKFNYGHEIIFKRYIEDGEKIISEYFKIIKKENVSIKNISGKFSEIFGENYIENSELIHQMISEGYYYKSNGKIIPNKGLIDVFNKFQIFLVNKNILFDWNIKWKDLQNEENNE
ncbi:hypothetical protein [Polaribacter sp. Asnod6-C07]|uniref:hypothetical protein n=1 Tax=Polaribacter sp. Asnod6-C07 TaxID=3160582 RepID=UPI00386DDEAA